MRYKFKVGDYVKIIKPEYDDKFIGDVCQVIDIGRYKEYPYECKYLNKHKCGYDSDIFKDDEIEKIGSEEAMVEML